MCKTCTGLWRSIVVGHVKRVLIQCRVSVESDAEALRPRERDVDDAVLIVQLVQARRQKRPLCPRYEALRI